MPKKKYTFNDSFAGIGSIHTAKLIPFFSEQMAFSIKIR